MIKKKEEKSEIIPVDLNVVDVPEPGTAPYLKEAKAEWKENREQKLIVKPKADHSGDSDLTDIRNKELDEKEENFSKHLNRWRPRPKDNPEVPLKIVRGLLG